MSKQLQRRSFSEPFKVRKNSDGTIGVRGYAAVFDSEAHGEVIRSVAFNRTIAQKDDIRLLVNHEGVPLARTKSGTLDVGVDERGLWFDAPSLDPTNPRVQELVSAMDRQDIDQCSFAGYFVDVRKVKGLDEVYEVKATDVSIVTYPWYDETEAGLTGDRDTDRALVSIRSLTDEQSDAVVDALSPTQRARIGHHLRYAPPGLTSYGDEQMALWDALEESVGTWVYIYDWGSDWAVYRQWSEDVYEWSGYLQIAWSVTDKAYTFGEPFAVEFVGEYRPVEADRSAPQISRDEPVAGAESVPPVESERTLSVTEARALLGNVA